jgi:membrane protein DedA with SNARE-associated domain
MIKELGASTMKTQNALDSLAKTDDMLAVIGIIMLVGVLVSSYGAYWQGKYAQATYNNECDCKKPDDTTKPESFFKKNKKMIWFVGIIIGLISILYIYIFNKKEGTNAPAASATSE